jgi:hypothetical protein
MMLLRPKLRTCVVVSCSVLLVVLLITTFQKRINYITTWNSYLPATPIVQFQSYSPTANHITIVEDTGSEILRGNVDIMKPHHTGHVEYITEISPDLNHYVYKRIFNVPCGYGLLVFNVGPAAEYEPYPYELYEDAYVYSNNEGLCLLYPSYTGIQSSTEPFWSFEDAMEMTVPLGDTPTRISSRIVIVPHSKSFNRTTTYHGGDYVIMRDGNFYNPNYYKNLKQAINSWPLHHLSSTTATTTTQ